MPKISQARVAEAIRNAISNGYDVNEWAPEELAQDLIDYDVQFENEEPGEIVALIVALRESLT